jgi:transcription factor CP2-like protein
MLNNTMEDQSEHSFDENSSLSNTENSFHINDNFDHYSKFHFILHAIPAVSSKINEETTTYLNQGQPYEIKLHTNKIKIENQSQSAIDYSLPITYRSILRLCFWDKSFQIHEHKIIDKWLNEYQFSSLFDIDMNLTYGILSIIRSKRIPNAVELVWDTSTTTSVFIRFKCTSTDFAHKRHGGEKGIPLRIQIDTYYENNLDQIEHIHSCCCKIQLFRLKGAQRKNKADKMKIEKLNFEQRRQYQTTFEYTLLQSCPSSALYSLHLLTLSQSPDDLFDISTTSTIEDKFIIEKKESNEINNTSIDLSLVYDPSKITIQSSHEDVFNWLNNNNFTSIVNRFQYYTGIDLLRLTINNIQEICDGDDAISIRLYNQLHETNIPPIKILYIKMADIDIYSAIYLHTLTRRELGEKLFQFIQQPQEEIFDIILELNKIKIKIDNDNVVKHSLPNEGLFYLKILPYQFFLCSLNSSN